MIGGQVRTSLHLAVPVCALPFPSSALCSHASSIALLAPLLPHVPAFILQYKFIVDGEWKYDPNQPAMFDEMGNVNNVIEVHEYVPENLDGLSGFEPPPSPPSRQVTLLRSQRVDAWDERQVVAVMGITLGSVMAVRKL